MKRTSAPSPTPRWFQFLIHPAVGPLLLAGLTFLVYANSIHGEFVFDDQAIVFHNPQLLNLKSLGEIFNFTGWREPLYVTYGLNFYLGGLNTSGYHLLSIALHALNSIIVFYVLLELGASRWPALAGGALFAVHPLLSGSVSYIAGRSSLLCGTFYLAAILAFLGGLRPQPIFYRVGLFCTAGLAAWLAWGVKQEAITLPVFLAGYLWVRRGARHWPVLAGLAAVPLAMVVVFRKEIADLAATVSRSDELVAAGYAPALPIFVYVRTYLTALVNYIYPKLIWPSGLNVDPDIRAVTNWYSPEFIVALCVIAGLAAAVLVWKRNDRFLLRVGILGLLASPLLAYALMPLTDVIQEHRIYIAGFGVAAIAAWAAQWSYGKYGTRAVAAVAAVIIVYGFWTSDRNRVWSNSVTLWQDAVEKSPAKARPHLNLGQAYERNGRPADALKEYEIAQRLEPGLVQTKLNIGLLYLQQGDLERAKLILESLRQTAPAYVTGWSQLGAVYVRLGQPDRALEIINDALKMKPDLDSALFARGDAYALKGQYDHSISDYKAAISLRPDVGIFRLRLGATYIRAGNPKAAEEEFRRLEADPNLGADASRNIGLLRMDVGDNDGAIPYFQRALQLRPNYPQVYHDLGLALMHKGMPERAIEQFKSALALNPDFVLAVVALSQAFEKAGRIQEARQVLTEDLQKFPAHDTQYVRDLMNRLQ